MARPKRALPKRRNPVAQAVRELGLYRNAAGSHKDRVARKRDVEQGRSRKAKHKHQNHEV